MGKEGVWAKSSDWKRMKKRLFNRQVKGSLIVTAALIIGSIILAVFLYGAEPGSELWELLAMLS